MEKVLINNNYVTMETPAQQVHRLMQQLVVAEHKYDFTPTADGFSCTVLLNGRKFVRTASTKQQAKHNVCEAILQTVPPEKRGVKPKCNHIQVLVAKQGKIKITIGECGNKSDRYAMSTSVILGKEVVLYNDEIDLHEIRYKANIHAGEFLRCTCLGFLPQEE
jgi:hypothetical protein